MQPDLLIADDYGMRAFTEQQTEDLWELIGERRHSLIVVSNRAPQDWYPLFPNPVLAESVLDRLINNAHHLVLTGRSYRPLRRPDRPGAGDPLPSDASTAEPGESPMPARPASRGMKSWQGGERGRVLAAGEVRSCTVWCSEPVGGV